MGTLGGLLIRGLSCLTDYYRQLLRFLAGLVKEKVYEAFDESYDAIISTAFDTHKK